MLLLICCFVLAGGVLENGSNDESVLTLGSESDLRPSGNAPAKKLGFGLSGLGKRTAVLSVFNEEDDDDSHKDKKMRPLVPIDYSAEELQATLPNAPGTTPPNMASAADVAKRPAMGSKDERSEAERDRSRRGHDKSSYRDRDQKDHETSRVREENREKSLGREHGDKSKSSENNNVVDAKQLIDMIPKTKEELFAYDINWAVYDKVSNKIQFDYVVVPLVVNYAKKLGFDPFFIFSNLSTIFLTCGWRPFTACTT